MYRLIDRILQIQHDFSTLFYSQKPTHNAHEETELNQIFEYNQFDQLLCYMNLIGILRHFSKLARAINPLIVNV